MTTWRCSICQKEYPEGEEAYQLIRGQVVGGVIANNMFPHDFSCLSCIQAIDFDAMVYHAITRYQQKIHKGELL